MPNGSRAQIVSYTVGIVAALVVVAGIYFGSGKLTTFDPPLAAYAAATVFAAFAITYRYAMWIQRPPTLRYFASGWMLFLRPGRLAQNLVKFVGLLWNNIVAQTFIEKRSPQRWMAHICIAWGCLIAFAITFPLSWGWIQFSSAENGKDYVVEFMGKAMMTFPPDGFIALLMFNALNQASAIDGVPYVG